MKTHLEADHCSATDMVEVVNSSQSDIQREQRIEPQLNTTEADAKLAEEIREALRDAKHGLTDDGLGAVVAIRRERRILSVIEELLLLGKIDARLRSGASEDTPLAFDNFEFALSVDGRSDSPVTK
jgi:hypothetical protein